MKQTLLLIFSFCLSLGLGAQDISFNPDPVVKHLTVNEVDVKVDFTVNNNTTREINVWWEFDRGNCPPEWDLYLCDINLCYTPSVTSCPCSKPNLLLGNSTNTFMMHVVPNGVMYDGKVFPWENWTVETKRYSTTVENVEGVEFVKQWAWN